MIRQQPFSECIAMSLSTHKMFVLIFWVLKYIFIESNVIQLLKAFLPSSSSLSIKNLKTTAGESSL